VKGLVVVDRPGIFGPELDFVQVQLSGAEIALDGIDEMAVERQVVEVPRPVGELLDTGELAPGIIRMGRRVGEVVLRSREMQPEGLLSGLQLVGSEESFDKSEALLADLIESGIRQPHNSEL